MRDARSLLKADQYLQNPRNDVDAPVSLNNQSNRLAALGRREDAVAAITEAVAIYRELAVARPEAFRPDLAGSLTSLG